MNINFFFKNKGPISIKNIASVCDGKHITQKDLSIKINNITNLYHAKNKDITFLNSGKYKLLASKTKATACITSEDLIKFPKSMAKFIK